MLSVSQKTVYDFINTAWNHGPNLTMFNPNHPNK